MSSLPLPLPHVCQVNVKDVEMRACAALYLILPGRRQAVGAPDALDAFTRDTQYAVRSVRCTLYVVRCTLLGGFCTYPLYVSVR
jgi:hypothetical protein